MMKSVQSSVLVVDVVLEVEVVLDVLLVLPKLRQELLQLSNLYFCLFLVSLFVAEVPVLLPT